MFVIRGRDIFRRHLKVDCWRNYSSCHSCISLIGDEVESESKGCPSPVTPLVPGKEQHKAARLRPSANKICVPAEFRSIPILVIYSDRELMCVVSSMHGRSVESRAAKRSPGFSEGGCCGQENL